MTVKSIETWILNLDSGVLKPNDNNCEIEFYVWFCNRNCTLILLFFLLCRYIASENCSSTGIMDQKYTNLICYPIEEGTCYCRVMFFGFSMIAHVWILIKICLWKWLNVIKCFTRWSSALASLINFRCVRNR